MRFTVIGHACLFIEVEGTTMLVDPWLGGSCYWRSWWHFPANTEVRPEHLAPDYVYLSHHHFDHFHFPSMRRLDRRARVLIPEFAVDVMGDEVRSLGFEHVTELPHGQRLGLTPALEVAAFQYGFDDSALLVRAGDVVLADLNDCKVKGRAADQLRRTFGRPTFVFKSHSWAQAYPNCYTAADARDLELLGRDDYAASFIATARELDARYAIPFASMVGFLHPETFRYNGAAVTPPEVAAACASVAMRGTEVVVLAPGDTWDVTGGFSRAGEAAYADSAGSLTRLASAAAPAIARAAEDEGRRRADFVQLKAYLEGFVRALPLPVRRLLGRPIVFHVPSSPTPFWVLDARRCTVHAATELPRNWATLVRIPEGVLADAIAKRILYFVHISLRVTVTLAAGGAAIDLPFWGLLSLYEQGYFPIRRVLGRRALRVWWRRRVEIAQLVATLVSWRGINKSVIGNVMTSGARSGDPDASARS